MNTSGTVLFVDVDTQEDFVAADGRLSVPGADALRSRFAALTRYASEHRIPILSTADAHAPHDPEFAVFPPHCIAGSDGAAKVAGTTLANAVAIEPDGGEVPDTPAEQVILRKTKLDMFSNPAAEEYMRRLRPDAVVVYGVATEYCVRLAVDGLVGRGFDVTVVEDAVAGVTPDGARGALEAMRGKGVHFAKTADIVGTNAAPSE